jgi:hypothetical protein
MSTYNEPIRALEFLVSEANGQRSREQVTLAANLGALVPGTVLGQATVGAEATATAFASNTGNGVMGTITVEAGAKAGDYKLVIIEAASDAGTFQVEDPDGIVIGVGSVGSEFSAGGLTFTLADGSTDFEGGDGFVITVDPGTGYYAPFDPDADDGTQIAAAILCYPAANSSNTQKATVIANDAEVQGALLDWGEAEAGEIAAGVAQLAAKGIKVRE